MTVVDVGFYLQESDLTSPLFERGAGVHVWF